MKTSIRITSEAKNSTFDNCKIYGGVEDSGQNTIFRKTIIGLEQKIKDHPLVYGIISALIGAIVTKILDKI